MRLLYALVLPPCLLALEPIPARTPQVAPVLELHRGEGVFAYARISPDGRHLASFSERVAYRVYRGRIAETLVLLVAGLALVLPVGRAHRLEPHRLLKGDWSRAHMAMMKPHQLPRAA